MSHSVADRNLLFGILAVQMDFVSRDALIAAMNAWVLDKAKPLGQILLEQQALDAEAHALLESVVRKHLEQHGDDPVRSLVGLSTAAPVHEALKQIADTELRTTLALLSPGAGNGSGSRPGETSAVPPARPGLRFHVLRPHARGGLGEVFVAHDAELNREVALKEIRGEHADKPSSRARFLLEAEVTGGLEHPGIVSVYGLGRYDDGRPFYAMRFIRGQSLAEAIGRFHAAEGADRDPGPRVLEFRQLLGRFLAVCDAVAYAHSRSVLHRDIKPANVMLGPFGETLVVDWGLAKPLDRPGSPPSESSERPLRPLSAGIVVSEQRGAAIGTPAYMSPEQAAGDLDRIGPASDVYGLGATLYALLTGRDPFPDRDNATVLRKVQRGEFPPPRQVNPQVPPALEAVCLKAMALRPEDRYASPRALADEIEHWLADEPVAVYREPWTTRVARWGRRHRPLVVGTAALLVTAVVALTVGTVLLARANARTEAQRRLAVEHFQIARRAVDQMLRELGEVELADVPQVEPVRRRLLEDAGRFYREFLARDGDDPAVLREAARASCGLGDVLALLGQHDDAESAYGRAVALLTGPGAEAPTPDARRALARAHHGLGVLLKQANRFEESEDHLRSALDLRRRLAGELRDDPSAAQDEQDTIYHLAALLGRLHGRFREAEAMYRAAVEAQRHLVARDPAQPETRRKLARDLNQWGLVLAQASPADAEAVFRQAHAIQEKLATQAPSVAGYRWDLARSSSNLGAVLAHRSPEEASEAFAKAEQLLRQLADDFPAVPDYRHERAAVLTNRAMLYLDAAKAPDVVEDALRAALALRTRLVQDFPRRFDYRHRLAEIRLVWGRWLFHAGQHREAEAAVREDLSVQEQLVGAFPNVPEYQSALGCALDNLALLLLDFGRLSEARDGLQRAIRHHRTALASNDRNQIYRGFLQNDLTNLAEVHWRLKAHAAAAAAAEDLHRLAPDDPEVSVLAAWNLTRCAALALSDPNLPGPRRQTQVQAYARRAVELLRKAFQQGFRNLDELEQSDYDLLRDREDFQKLLEAIRAASQTAVG